MNNRKQQVYSFLDSLTSKEIQDYINDRKLNKDHKKMLEYIARRKPKSHLEKLFNEEIIDNYYTNLNAIINKTYKIGRGHIIAFLLRLFYDNNYKLDEIIPQLQQLMNEDDELKEYVYAMMKDL